MGLSTNKHHGGQQAVLALAGRMHRAAWSRNSRQKKHGNHGSIHGFFQGHVSIFPMGNPLGLHPMSIF